MTTRALLCMLTLTVMLATPAFANQLPKEGDPSCQDSELLSVKLITEICWECLFPIRVAGVSLGSGTVPTGASNQSVCWCDDALGVPHPGLVISMWQPARLVEVVHASGCSMVLGGLRLPLSDWRMQGTDGNYELDESDMSFMHFHYYAFPLLMILELFTDKSCNPDGFVDLDLAFLSELDPTWNNDELAFFANPEAAAVANPLALAACAVDATASTAGRPIDEMFWCAGAWGGLYPMSGSDISQGSLATRTSLLATRAITQLHRRGMARRTMGNDALCNGRIDPIMTKSQYKMSMFFPVAEAGDNVTFTVDDGAGGTTNKTMKMAGAHMIGESAYIWGEWRDIPAVGEDAIYILFRWNDCCDTF